MSTITRHHPLGPVRAWWAAASPICGGVVICTTKMNKILSYDLENFAVTVQPGVLLQDLANDAHGPRLYVSPRSRRKAATLGGNVATNASGCGGSSTAPPGTM